MPAPLPRPPAAGHARWSSPALWALIFLGAGLLALEIPALARFAERNQVALAFIRGAPVAAPPPTDARALRLAGQAALARGQVNQAAALYTQALALQPADPLLQSGRADVFWADRRFDQAAALWRASGNIGRLKRAGAALTAQGDYTDAIHSLTAAVALSPDDVLAQLWLGQALLNAQQPAPAAAAYRQALARDPGEMWAYLGLGVAYRQQRDFDQADHWCRAAAVTQAAGVAARINACLAANAAARRQAAPPLSR